jgi:NAD-dependent dihydropyrimidine dehydrogenase PreA subunit
MLLASTAATVLVGALFCGWLCPLGSVQDWVGGLGRRLLGARRTSDRPPATPLPCVWPRRTAAGLGRRCNTFVPRRLDQALGYLRYAVLGLIVVTTTRAVHLVFAAYDPYYALVRFWSGDALPGAVAVLAVVLGASLFVERPWCRWLCPFGAVQGLMQLVAPWKIRRNAAVCTDCGCCTRACPMGIAVAEKVVVRDTRCNRCGECLAACPVRGALDHRLPGRRGAPAAIPALSMRSRFLTAALALSIFAAPIAVSTASGLFVTSGRAVVARGSLSVDQISASMTLTDVSTGLGIEIDRLREILELPAEVERNTQIKDLEELPQGLSTRAVKDRLRAVNS